MKNKKLVFIFFLVLFLLLSSEIKALGSGVEMIKNGGFELGNNGDWLGTCGFSKFIKQLPNMSGSWFANFDSDNSVTTEIYQDIVLPKDKKITLSFDYEYKEGNSDGEVNIYFFYFDYKKMEHQPFYVLKLSDLDEINDTTNLVKTFKFDASQFAGEKVSFDVLVKNAGGNNFSIDNVSILAEDKNTFPILNINKVFLKKINNNFLVQRKK